MTTYSKRNSSATQKMADGGSVGFLERLRQGNKDQEGSEANMLYSRGKDRMAAAVAENSASKPSKAEPSMPAAAVADDAASQPAPDTRDDYDGGAAPSSETSSPTKPAPAPTRKQPTAAHKPPTAGRGGGGADEVKRETRGVTAPKVTPGRFVAERNEKAAFNKRLIEGHTKNREVANELARESKGKPPEPPTSAQRTPHDQAADWFKRKFAGASGPTGGMVNGGMVGSTAHQPIANIPHTASNSGQGAHPQGGGRKSYKK